MNLDRLLGSSLKEPGQWTWQLPPQSKDTRPFHRVLPHCLPITYQYHYTKYTIHRSEYATRPRANVPLRTSRPRPIITDTSADTPLEVVQQLFQKKFVSVPLALLAPLPP